MKTTNTSEAKKLAAGGMLMNRAESLKVRTGVKAGSMAWGANRCESLKVRTGVKAGAGGLPGNRCETVARGR